MLGCLVKKKKMMMMMNTDVEECHLAQRTGASIILQAMKEGKVQLAHFVLVALGEAAANAPLDSAVSAGRTLLMHASTLPRITERSCFMQLLLGRGADVQRQDVAGRTALSLASERGYLDAVHLLVLHGASPETPDHRGRSPLDYAVDGHHDDVARFLLINESKGLKGQEMQTRESGEILVNSLSHPVCQRSVSDPLPIEQIIHNPFTLYKEEESRILNMIKHNHRKSTKLINPVAPLPSEAPLYDQILQNPNLQPCNPEETEDKASSNPTKHFPNLHQFTSKINSNKNGFLPAWMKKSPESSISKPSVSFSKRMASKMALISSSSLRESQTNLLIPQGEVTDSPLSKIPQDLSERKLRHDVTETALLRNHRFLEESSRRTDTAERFPENESERWSCSEKLHHNHIKWSRDKYLSSVMRNAVHYWSQSEQNRGLSRSGCNVYRALRTRTHPDLRFLQTGKLDPEQEELLRGERNNTREFLE